MTSPSTPAGSHTTTAPRAAAGSRTPAGRRTLADYRAASQCSPGYLNFAGIGPLLAPVTRARADAAAILASQPERLVELDGAADRARLLGAQLLGLDGSRVILAPNTSTGLFQAAFAVPAGEVVVSPFDFPANTRPWLRAQEHGEVSVRWMAAPDGPRPRVTPDLVAAAITPQTVAVSVSAVDFATGAVVDLAGIRDAIGDRLLVVDAIQGIGVVDLPWAAADLITGGGQKWLRAGWSTGLLACSPRALDRLGPGLSGWSGAQGTEDPRSLAVLAAPRGDVGRFSITPPDMVAMAGFAAALDLLTGVGIGEIAARIRVLARRAREGLVGAGAALRGGLDTGDISGITSFTVPGHPAGEVVRALAAGGMVVSERQGGVRVSIHASTDEQSIDRLVAVVGSLVRGS